MLVYYTHVNTRRVWDRHLHAAPGCLPQLVEPLRAPVVFQNDWLGPVAVVGVFLNVLFDFQLGGQVESLERVQVLLVVLKEWKTDGLGPYRREIGILCQHLHEPHPQRVRNLLSSGHVVTLKEQHSVRIHDLTSSAGIGCVISFNQQHTTHMHDLTVPLRTLSCAAHRLRPASCFRPRSR